MSCPNCLVSIHGIANTEMRAFKKNLIAVN